MRNFSCSAGTWPSWAAADRADRRNNVPARRRSVGGHHDSTATAVRPSGSGVPRSDRGPSFRRRMPGPPSLCPQHAVGFSRATRLSGRAWWPRLESVRPRRPRRLGPRSSSHHMPWPRPSPQVVRSGVCRRDWYEGSDGRPDSPSQASASTAVPGLKSSTHGMLGFSASFDRVVFRMPADQERPGQKARNHPRSNVHGGRLRWQPGRHLALLHAPRVAPIRTMVRIESVVEGRLLRVPRLRASDRTRPGGTTGSRTSDVTPPSHVAPSVAPCT